MKVSMMEVITRCNTLMLLETPKERVRGVKSYIPE
jgi:hypothetical protein